MPRRDSVFVPAIAAILLLVTALYLMPFVARGWIPHDEGTIAGGALRLLAGEWPHRDFDDPYSGGMTWLYAGLFRWIGIDLVTIRWSVFLAALVATASWFHIGLAVAPPWLAALVAFTCLVWSIPNYYSGVPSWWVLLLGSLQVSALSRFLATDRERWLVASGLVIGIAVIFKQSAVYLVPAGWLVLAFHDSDERLAAGGGRTWASMAVRVLAFTLVLAGLAFVLALNPSTGALMLFVWPAALMAGVVVAAEWRLTEGASPAGEGIGRLLRRSALLGGAAALPAVALGLAYWRGGAARSLYEGALLQPQSRGTLASFDPGSPAMVVAFAFYLVAVIMLVADSSRQRAPRRRAPAWLAWLSLAVVVAALGTSLGYRLVWNAVRFSLLGLGPLAVVMLRRRIGSRGQRTMLYALTASASFLALFQFPLPFPIYFCFAAPLVVLSLVTTLRLAGVTTTNLTALVIALAIFGLVSNRGYADTIGLEPRTIIFDTPLGLPRASLMVSKSDRDLYQQVVALIHSASRGDDVHAFPDCPEIYFLSGRPNPTRSNYEFFRPQSAEALTAFWQSKRIRVVVLNQTPPYSAPPSEAVLRAARQAFPDGKRVGRFEVRWKSSNDSAGIE
jgi:hypothetical protein